jgi:hypothetical protein
VLGEAHKLFDELSDMLTEMRREFAGRLQAAVTTGRLGQVRARTTKPIKTQTAIMTSMPMTKASKRRGTA